MAELVRLMRWLTGAFGGRPAQNIYNDYIPLRETDIAPTTSSLIMATERGVDMVQAEETLDEKKKGHKIQSHHEEVDDLPQPTDEEKATLRRVSDHIPFAAFTIVVVELCERFAFYGLSGVFQNYIQNPLPAGGSGSGAPVSATSSQPAGALGRGQTTATGLQQMFSFLAYIFPIMGAIIADAKWGRYKTITVFCLIYFIGLLIITATSVPSALKAGAGLPGWIVGAIVVALGTGGIKGQLISYPAPALL